jgi:hypothetical protein
MKTMLKPIALNEKSYNINLLHKALEALRFPVAKREVAHGKAGNDTLKKVRALQARLNMPVDDSTLVDEATSLAIAEALKKRGFTVVAHGIPRGKNQFRIPEYHLRQDKTNEIYRHYRGKAHGVGEFP